MADMTGQIAGEAHETRERISATIDELQERLNPRRIMADAVSAVQASGAEMLNSGLGLVRAHPAMLAGAGIAAGLALLGERKLRGAKVDLGDPSESYSDYDDDYADRGAPGETSTERFTLLRPSSTSIDNPLIAVVIGLAAGALLGALFPETERERRLLGASADRLGAAARAAARTARDELGVAGEKVADVAAQAKSAVQSVVDAAKSELHG